MNSNRAATARGSRWQLFCCFSATSVRESDASEDRNQGTHSGTFNPLASSNLQQQQHRAADLAPPEQRPVSVPSPPEQGKTAQLPTPAAYSQACTSHARSSCNSYTFSNQSQSQDYLTYLIDNSAVLRLLSPTPEALPFDASANLSLDMPSGLIFGLSSANPGSSTGFQSHHSFNGTSLNPTPVLPASAATSGPLQGPHGDSSVPGPTRNNTHLLTQMHAPVAIAGRAGFNTHPASRAVDRAPVSRALRAVTLLPSKDATSKPSKAAAPAGAPVFPACDALQVLVQASVNRERSQLSPTMQRWNTMVMQAQQEERTAAMSQLRHSPQSAGERGLQTATPGLRRQPSFMPKTSTPPGL